MSCGTRLEKPGLLRSSALSETLANKGGTGNAAIVRPAAEFHNRMA